MPASHWDRVAPGIRPAGKKGPTARSPLAALGGFRRAVPGCIGDASGRGRVGAPPQPRLPPGGRARTRLRPLSARELSRSRQARSRLSVSEQTLPPGTVELGPPFAREFCGRLGSAVTSQRAGPAATMVAKDYPFYLTVKRANCSLEVPPASSPAKDAEVGPPPGPLRIRVRLSVPLSRSISHSLGSLAVSVSQCLHLLFNMFPHLLSFLLPFPLPLSLLLSPSLSFPLPISRTHILSPHVSLCLCFPSSAPSLWIIMNLLLCPRSLPLGQGAAASLPWPLLHPSGLSDFWQRDFLLLYP